MICGEPPRPDCRLPVYVAEDIAAILNHKRADVTGRHYDQYQRAEEKRAALQRWSQEYLSGIIEGKPSPAKVVELRG